MKERPASVTSSAKRRCVDILSDVKEGWLGDDYLILFTDRESPVISERYRIESMLPGYQVIGLRGWDDFIVKDKTGSVFTVPTVPCSSEHLTPFHLPAAIEGLTTDDRFTGKVKWYVTPVVFGGDAGLGQNLVWITHDEHVVSVLWWNALYRDLSRKA